MPDKTKAASRSAGKEVIVKNEQTTLPDIPLTDEELNKWIEERKKQEVRQ